MTLNVTETGQSCGAYIAGVDLSDALSDDCVAEIRSLWLTHKVLIFPQQKLSNHDLERFTAYFGSFGEDPFFGHIEGHKNIAAIQRNADEKTPIFAEVLHSDWSFLTIPPAGTVLYSLIIPPHGGNTLFANQVLAYERLPDRLRDLADSLTAIHSAELGYAPDGAYGENDEGRSMNIIYSDKAYERNTHPFVRTHPETGEKALFSSPAYIRGFEGLDKAESDALLMEFFGHQSQEDLIYSHPWQKDMLVMWDNRSLLHAATGGYDGYDRLLHRLTIADTRF